MNVEKSVHNALWGSESWEISVHPFDPSVIAGGMIKLWRSFGVRVIWWDKAVVERTMDGWFLVKDGRRLAVGDGKWAATEWRFSDDLVEPLFEWCGTRKIAANGRLDENGALLVSWQFLGGVAHGCFKVSDSNL